MLEQLPEESRAEYIARISATVEAERVGKRRQSFDLRFIAGLRWLLVGFFRHWLLLANLFYALLLLNSVLITPWLFSTGQTGLASFLFTATTIVCDQVPTHSYYLFGYQMCLCQRCIAIYGAFLLGGLLYAWLRRYKTYRYMPWKYLLILSLPILVDGLTQLYGARESNILLRSMTGGLFGLAYVATVYPWFDALKHKLFKLWQVEDEPASNVPALVEAAS